MWRDENRRTGRKTLREKKRTNNKLDPLMTPDPGFHPGLHCRHWWEASAVTTAPTPPLHCKLKSAVVHITARVASCGNMLHEVDMSSIFCNVLPKLATQVVTTVFHLPCNKLWDKLNENVALNRAYPKRLELVHLY